MSYFTDPMAAIEEAEYLARGEKLNYGVRLEGEGFVVYQIERRGEHNPLEILGNRNGRWICS